MIMKKITANLHNIVLGVIVIAGLSLAYYFFARTPASDVQVTVAGRSQNLSLEGQQALTLLEEINTITINRDVITNPTLQSLEDLHQTVPTQPQGRPDPFAPIGSN